MEKLKLEYINPEDLVFHEDNPRIHPESQIDMITNSIEQFGFIDPILATSDNVVMAGHGRLLSALDKGLTEVPVIKFPFDEVKAKAYMVADNKIAELGRWNIPQLKLILEDLVEDFYDVTITGFQGDELNRLLPNIGAVENYDEMDDFELDDEEEEEKQATPPLNNQEGEKREIIRREKDIPLHITEYKVKRKDIDNPDAKMKKGEEYVMNMNKYECELLKTDLDKFTNTLTNPEVTKGFINYLLKDLGIT